MSYLVLARRWRPRRFADLVGQDVVVRTLKNALARGHLAHAYMLCGIRGVGKTTIARLMAMAVNCEAPEQGEPCGACAACTGIADGSNLDVQEMDAASHTGVDDIREILDGVRYPPNTLRYKVYIIDEAHMLSKSAFNALLKTLEEPPERVLFVLATTESEKLPVTVRSRCQRFDLRRLSQQEIAGYLGHVFAEEEIEAESAAVDAIARAADGSVRDALSLAERVLAYHREKLTLEAVQQALGVVGGELIHRLSDRILAGEAKAAVESLREGMDGGHAPRGLLLELSRRWHAMACLLVDPGLLDDAIDALEREWLHKAVAAIDYHRLDLLYQVLIAGLRDLSLCDERLAAEMLILRLAGLHQLRHEQQRPEKGSASRRQEAETRASAAEHSRPAGNEAEEPALSGSAASDERRDADLPLHADAPGAAFDSWQAAVDAFAKVRPGVAAMLDHVVCHEFGDRIRLGLDKHQQRAIAPADRMAFSEWLGREILWESRRDGPGESLSQERARQARAEAARLRQNAEADPHVQALMKEMDARLIRVSPAGVEQQSGENE